jgi:hypothetical protein
MNSVSKVSGTTRFALMESMACPSRMNSQFLLLDQLAEIESQRAGIHGQLFRRFLEGHEDAGFVVLRDPFDKKLNGEESLATTGAAADQSGSASGQASVGDFIESGDT